MRIPQELNPDNDISLPNGKLLIRRLKQELLLEYPMQ